ncbi:MAG: molybdenum cofactor biosynthesis protein MoaE [Candidatus Thorarchaeota archaeon]|nr:molybdenum cofactor biosynthesis protein MoaE [Candidatus Thorarchaeota archaeon]
MIEVTEADFQIDQIIAETRKPSMGCIVLFLGTVRDMTDDRAVLGIELESDEKEAIRQLTQVRDETIEKFGVTDVSIVHRVGSLSVGENIVLIAVGAGHRPEAFAGCRYAIERLKEFVHIWKKEITEEGEYWIGDRKNDK